MITRFFRENVAASLAIGVALTALLPICSRADDSVGTAKVTFTTAMLQSDEGAAKVYSRIVQAANTACETSSTDIDVIVRGRPSLCVQRAVAHAVSQLNSPNLTHVYVVHTGTELAREYGISETLTASK